MNWMMVLGSSGERLDNVTSCLAGGVNDGNMWERTEGWFCWFQTLPQHKGSKWHNSDFYLSVQIAGQNTPPHLQQRSDHNPGSRARPSLWLQRRACSLFSMLRMCCGMVWSSCCPDTARPAQNILPDGSRGSTHHWGDHGWHSGGGTLLLTQPQNDSGDQECWGIWFCRNGGIRMLLWKYLQRPYVCINSLWSHG